MFGQSLGSSGVLTWIVVTYGLRHSMPGSVVPALAAGRRLVPKIGHPSGQASLHLIITRVCVALSHNTTIEIAARRPPHYSLVRSSRG